MLNDAEDFWIIIYCGQFDFHFMRRIKALNFS